MNSLNSVLLEGNLVQDPEYKTTPKGTPVSTFAIATNRYFREGTEMKQDVSYFNIETWGKLAEQVHTLGHKGRGVRIVGRLKQDRWTDPEGKHLSKIFIVAEHVEMKPEFSREHNKETEQEVIER